jgi:hypothetical protein
VAACKPHRTDFSGRSIYSIICNFISAGILAEFSEQYSIFLANSQTVDFTVVACGGWKPFNYLLLVNRKQFYGAGGNDYSFCAFHDINLRTDTLETQTKTQSTIIISPIPEVQSVQE